jgi:8-oxo-dGTP pyrophosphatase MutT (NUDIX family)
VDNLPVPSPAGAGGADPVSVPRPEPRELTVARRTAFSGRQLRVRVDTVRLPSGEVATREVVELPASAAVVAVDEHWNVWLVRRWRRSAERAVIELPCGSLAPGQTSLSAARRELAGQIGLAATTFEHLATVRPGGWSSEVVGVFLAVGLNPLPEHRPDPDVIEVVRLPLDAALAAVWSGEIDDGRTVAGLLLARAALGGDDPRRGD